MTQIKGETILNAGIYVGVTAAAAVLTSNPIGAAGGAIFGACHIASSYCSRWVMNTVIDKNSQNGQMAIDICSLAAGLFLAWKAAEALGVAMTFTASVKLAAAGIGVVVGAYLAYLVLAVGCTLACAGGMAAASSSAKFPY